MTRSAFLSIAFGVVAALVVTAIGPVYATPLLIVAVPVVFLTIPRAVTGSTVKPDFEWLLFALGVTLFVAFPYSPIVRSSPGAWPATAILGATPILLAMVLLLRRRMVGSRHA